MGLARRRDDYELMNDRAAQSLHAVNLGGSLSSLAPVQRIQAKRRVHIVDGQQLASVDNEWNDDVVKLTAHNPTRVVYSISMSVGTPAQPMEVIFDTGSYMLAIFAKPPPEGMKPLLKEVPDVKAKKSPVMTVQESQILPSPFDAKHNVNVRGGPDGDVGFEGNAHELAIDGTDSPEHVKESLIRMLIRKMIRSDSTSGRVEALQVCMCACIYSAFASCASNEHCGHSRGSVHVYEAKCTRGFEVYVSLQQHDVEPQHDTTVSYTRVPLTTCISHSRSQAQGTSYTRTQVF